MAHPSKRAPKMVSGRRGAKDSEDAAQKAQDAESDRQQRILAASLEATEKAKKAAAKVEVDENGQLSTPVEFGSRFKEFRVQITSPADTFVPATGQVIKGRPKFAQFHDYSFRTTDAEIVKKLREYRHFGTMVFETSIVTAASEAAVVENILSTIKSDPKVRQQVLASLEGREFAMPPTTPPAGS